MYNVSRNNVAEMFFVEDACRLQKKSIEEDYNWWIVFAKIIINILTTARAGIHALRAHLPLLICGFASLLQCPPQPMPPSLSLVMQGIIP